MTKAKYRKQLRAMRAKFPPLKRALAARKLSLQLLHCGFFVPRARLAFYLANDGEINTAPAIKMARRAACKIYLPKVESNKSLSFHRFALLSPKKLNQYNIQEVCSLTLPVKELDIVFLPLVGFDRVGNRLGMGGGYYDRTLEGVHNSARRPLLVGLAYSEQELANIESSSHDVKLDCVVTENEVLIF